MLPVSLACGLWHLMSNAASRAWQDMAAAHAATLCLQLPAEISKALYGDPPH